ncbi:hypothetical protein [Tropicimonas aquimaris]|uniref:Capsular polysaccharide transport system permease protein n=1 Tax=Tropicimonas aquimaris TaxID=914152 RepID=A0ABW3IVA6_9RHOB
MSKNEAAEPRSAQAPTSGKDTARLERPNAGAPSEGAVLKVLRKEPPMRDPSSPQPRTAADDSASETASEALDEQGNVEAAADSSEDAGEKRNRKRMLRRAARSAAKEAALEGPGAEAVVRPRKGRGAKADQTAVAADPGAPSAAGAVFVSARSATDAKAVSTPVADTSAGKAGAPAAPAEASNDSDNGNSGDGGRAARRRRRKRAKVDPLTVSPPRPGAPPIPVMPPAPAARRQKRHVGIMLSFVLFVIAPVAVAGWYLYERAADQYASSMGFSVRKEEAANAAEVIGGIAGFVGADTSDTDILYEFIQSQALVEMIDERLDLRSLYSKPENDWFFTIDPDAPIEKLVSYWRRMVTIYYDGASGLIETRVLAFTPEDAQTISRAIFEESSNTINKLTAVARDDATRYARDELALAEQRLREARSELTEFRARTQIVDPAIDVQGQMGLLTTLQSQLAEALIELDLLLDNTREGDPRIRQAEQRITVIENRIADERSKIGIGGTSAGTQAFSSLVGEYESLIVDREFAEQSYLAARANLDAAQAEAQRQTRYLAAYTQPTLAQSSEYPQRSMLLGVFGLFALAAWSVGALIYYSIRDRR